MITPVQQPITQTPILIILIIKYPIIAPTLALLRKIRVIIIWDKPSISRMKKRSKEMAVMVDAMLNKNMVSLNIFPPYIILYDPKIMNIIPNIQE